MLPVLRQEAPWHCLACKRGTEDGQGSDQGTPGPLSVCKLTLEGPQRGSRPAQPLPFGWLPPRPSPQAAYDHWTQPCSACGRWQRGRRKKRGEVPNSSLRCHGYCSIIRDECYWLLWQPKGPGSIPRQVMVRRQSVVLPASRGK